MTASARGKHKQLVPVDLEDSAPFGYSQCLRVGSLVYIAGQCGLGPDHQVVSLNFEPQARAALERVQKAVEAAGGEIDDIVAMTVYLTDVRSGRIFTDIRREFFRQPFPTSALIGVSQLMPLNAQIEIQATAIVHLPSDEIGDSA